MDLHDRSCLRLPDHSEQGCYKTACPSVAVLSLVYRPYPITLKAFPPMSHHRPYSDRIRLQLAGFQSSPPHNEDLCGSNPPISALSLLSEDPWLPYANYYRHLYYDISHCQNLRYGN